MSGKSGGFFASKGYKNLMKYVYGYGASVVILGALFKIMHWPGCDTMLIIGLSTEAIIFGLSAMEPLHAEPNWAVYYPYLLPEDERPQSADELAAFPKPLDLAGGSASASTGITEKFDELLAAAKIDQSLLDRLGSSMRDLSHNAEQLKSVSSAAAATDSYVASLEAASNKVTALSSDYEKASAALVGITAAQSDGESMGIAMQGVSKNLTALNNVYELQLQGSSAHLEATQGFQKQVEEMMTDLSASAQDTKLYRDNMAMLAQNLADLNNVYGNMLKAMKS
ncbi:MAG: gliding motility protein GldL [Flavobacteriia bacterium]|nr:gliding motility protein GldL [Flavobacteriia bacterium]